MKLEVARISGDTLDPVLGEDALVVAADSGAERKDAQDSDRADVFGAPNCPVSEKLAAAQGRAVHFPPTPCQTTDATATDAGESTGQASLTRRQSIFLPTADANRCSVATVGFISPRSRRATAEIEVFIRPATSAWVSRAARRAAARSRRRRLRSAAASMRRGKSGFRAVRSAT